MPRVTMPKDHQSAELVVAGQRVQRGKSIEVDDETAAGLAEQGWSVADVKKAAPVKAAAKKSANTEAPKGDPQPASPDADPKES